MSYSFLLGVVGCLVLCMYEYRRRLIRLEDSVKCDYNIIVRLHIKINDLEREIEDRFRWKDSGVPVNIED